MAMEIIVEINQLRSFIEICRLSSITKAAEQLFISQQALSKQIQSLEGELGSALLIRTSRGVDLTEAGRVLLPEAKHLVWEHDEIVRKISSNQGCRRLRTISMEKGLLFNDPGNTLKDIQASYREKTGVSLQWHDDDGDTCIDNVTSGARDAALTILTGQRELDRLRVDVIGRLPLYLLLKKSNPYYSKDEVDADMLSSFVFPCPSDVVEQWIVCLYRSYGSTANPRLTQHPRETMNLNAVWETADCNALFGWRSLYSPSVWQDAKVIPVPSLDFELGLISDKDVDEDSASLLGTIVRDHLDAF